MTESEHRPSRRKAAAAIGIALFLIIAVSAVSYQLVLPPNPADGNGTEPPSPPPTTTQDPIADAGSDQTVEDADNNGEELVTLDGSGSSDPDGTIQKYEWKEDSAILGTGQTLDATFSVGAYTVVLTVTDNEFATDSDTVKITVEPFNPPPPPPGVITLTVQDSETPWAFEINDEANPTIRLKQGETIEIRFVNDGNTVHDFTIEELGITDETTFLEPGEEVTITIKGEKTGTFTYFCSQPGHKDLGMSGELIVE